MYKRTLQNFKVNRNKCQNCKVKKETGSYVFNSVVSIMTMNKKNSEGIQGTLANGGRRVAQIIDQLWYHWLHDLVHDVSIQSW